MTGTTNPGTFSPAMLAASQLLLRDLTRAETRARRDYQQWRVAPRTSDYKPDAPRDAAGDSMMSAMLGTLLLESLFGGMPVLSSLSEMTGDMAQGLAQIGLMNGQQDYNDAHLSEDDAAMNYFTRREQQRHNKATAFEDLLRDAEQEEALQALLEQKNQQKRLAMLKQLMLVLVMQMMQQGGEKETQGGDGALVPSPLHKNQKLAQFKQNRQSVSCIRTLFQREVNVVAPRIKAPKYTCAA